MNPVVTKFLDPIFQAIAVTLASLLVAVLARLAKRLGIGISADEEERLREHARDAVLYTEEWGAKKTEAGIKPSSDALLAKASALLLAKFPTLTPAKLDFVVHAAISELGLGKAAELAQTKIISSIDSLAPQAGGVKSAPPLPSGWSPPVIVETADPTAPAPLPPAPTDPNEPTK